MRYTEAVQPLETGGMIETRQFTIAATGKAFKNLMDGLYSRKIEAFCREILTNAFDSHCEAGRPEFLFEVWVPTIFDKRLKVRDFGVGMPHEQVMSRYSTLFDSTKDHSDEFVGMLGLGSKSPFAYTDGFSLRCWDGEECRTYSAYLGPGGVPQISLAGRVPSDEPRGVEVGIPVASEDFRRVETALARVCVGFAHPPKLPVHVESVMCFKYSLYGDGWAVGKCDALGAGTFARQGCVLYPVEDSVLCEVFPDWESPTNSVVLDFPLGALEVTPSRESLSVTDKTKKALREKVEHFVREISDEIAHKFTECKTEWEIAEKFSGLNIDKLPKSLLKVTPQAKIYARISSTLNEIMYQARGSRAAHRWVLIEIAQLGGYHQSGRIYDAEGYRYSVTNGADSYHLRRFKFPKEDKPYLFVVDSEKSNAKIAHWLHTHKKDRALVLRKSATADKHGHYEHRLPAQGPPTKWEDHDSVTALVWSKKFSEITEDDLLRMKPVADLGHPPFLKASTFAKPPKEEKPRPPREDGMIYDPKTGQWNVAERKDLNALRVTHKFLFYSKLQKSVLRPRGDKPAGEWERMYGLESSLKELMENCKIVTGVTPKLALIRVTPKTEYREVRGFPLAESLEKTLLDNAPEEFWEDAIPHILWESSGIHTLLQERKPLARVLQKAANPNVRRVGRLMEIYCVRRESENLRIKTRPTSVKKMTKAQAQGEERRRQQCENRRYYRNRRIKLLRDLIARNEVVMSRFVEECRKRDYRVPYIAPRSEFGHWGSGKDWLSPRWTLFVDKFADFVSHVKEESEMSVYFSALEMAELKLQRKGGRISDE